jgi:hypothetical protein
VNLGAPSRWSPWLLGATARNYVLHQARRLRRPRYAIPGALALLYFWSVLQRPASAILDERFPWAGILTTHAESILGALFTVGVLGSWVLGKPKPRLVFTEAEVQFLFAAPVARRQVVHHRLMKALLQSGFGAAILTLFFARATTGSAGALALAIWAALSILELHGIAASFARAWLHGRFEGLRLRAVQLSAAASIAAALAIAPTTPAGGGPGSWLLWPARLAVRPIVTRGTGPFSLALLVALLLLAAHYAWVLVAAERFEDAAVESAERAARRLEALRGGATAVVVGGKGRSAPFRLPRTAGPEIALAWKGLIAISRSLVVRMAAIVVVPVTTAVVIGVFVLIPGEAVPAAVAAGRVAAMGLFLVLLLGPTMTGGGVSGDLSRLDVLRALPVSGARIVLGQALAPALILSVLWGVLVPAASFLLPLGLGGFERACTAVGMLVVGPPILLLEVLLQAAVVLALPGWTTAGPGPMAMGQRMLAMVVQFVGFPLVALPAGLVAALSITVALPIVGWSAIPASALLAALVLIGEIALALLVIGRLFEKLDPSDL